MDKNMGMKQFALLFRMDITTRSVQPTAEQMQGYMKQWMAWIKSIASKNQLAEGGNHFSNEGIVLGPGGKITRNVYTADKLSVAGYILVYASNFDKAMKIAEKCPILQGDHTSVEIREVATPGA